MKGSSLHRAGLSKERMAMLENIKPNNLQNDEIPQYSKAQPNELDLLYKNVEKGFIQARTTLERTPAVYLLVGFIAGVIFTTIVAVLIGLSATSPNETEIEEAPTKEKVTVETPVSNESSRLAYEKYTVKSGDTIDKIAYKFYGVYDLDKIQKILDVNNLKNPEKLQIGQILAIPME